jgi:hypothetical protein
MTDLSQLSDEQLMQIAAGGQIQPQAQPSTMGQQDLSSLTDEQLQAIASQEQPVDTGLLARIADSFTGKSRRTKEIESLPDWRESMPEFSLSSGIPALKTAIGTMSTNPEETAKIILANFPDVQMRQDEKGNYIFKSGIDQKEYALKPGFRASDIPRAVVGALTFLPAGRATSLLGAFGANAATQAAIEASQAATGGEFNAGEVGVAGALVLAHAFAFALAAVAVPTAPACRAWSASLPLLSTPAWGCFVVEVAVRV